MLDRLDEKGEKTLHMLLYSMPFSSQWHTRMSPSNADSDVYELSELIQPSSAL